MPPNNSIFYIIKHHSTVHTKQCLYIIPYFRVFCKRVTHIFLKIFIAGRTRRFPAPADRGTRTAAGGFALTGRLPFLHRRTGVLELRKRVRPTGRLLFLHRLSGVLELRQRVRPNGAAPFLHRFSGALELPQAGSPFPGRKFFAEPQREIRRRCGGSVAAPAAGAKRKGHLRFPFLFELLPFPCLLARRRLPTCDRSETGERQRIFSSVSFSTCSQCQIHYCYTDQKTSAGRGIAVPRNS